MEKQYGRPIFTPVPQPPPHDLHYDRMVLGGGGDGMMFRSDSTMGSLTAGGGLEMEIGGGGGGNGRWRRQETHDLLDVRTELDRMVLGGGGGGMMFRSDSTTGTGSTTASLSAGGGLQMKIGGGGGGGNGRWRRQETHDLLDVRTELDSKFKEANQKGPVWDEVSRIMSEKHGYQKSGKKCREKFENVYKYYKKTKEGKAGRQDGKHYRFFPQLEALYGKTSTSINPNPNPNPNPGSFPDPHNINVDQTSGFQAHPHPTNSSYQEAFHPAPSRLCDSPSLSNNSSAFDKTLGKRSRKTKFEDYIDAQMGKIMEKQEEWMEKVMKSIEQKEQERVLREEHWKKEEAARFEKEHTWMESRDSALMEALRKLTGKESNHKSSSSPNDQTLHDHNNGKIDSTVNLTGWGENEITRLIQLRTSMETRFEQGGYMEELLWEEIASKMACLGYTRNGISCKIKWDSINEFLMRTKKRKENTRSSNSYNNESLTHLFHHQMGSYRQADDRLIAPNNQQNDGSYRFMMGDPENMWDGYGMKLNKGEDDH